MNMTRREAAQESAGPTETEGKVVSSEEGSHRHVPKAAKQENKFSVTAVIFSMQDAS